MTLILSPPTKTVISRRRYRRNLAAPCSGRFLGFRGIFIEQDMAIRVVN